MSCVYKISLRGRSKAGTISHFNAEVKVDKHFDFSGDAERVKSALKPLIARQNPGLYEKWGATPASIHIESYHYNYIDDIKSNQKPSKKSNHKNGPSILDKMGTLGTIIKIIIWPIRMFFKLFFKIAEFVFK